MLQEGIGSHGTPIYFNEQTVGKDDKLYDVMILIKPKSGNHNAVDQSKIQVLDSQEEENIGPKQLQLKKNLQENFNEQKSSRV